MFISLGAQEDNVPKHMRSNIALKTLTLVILVTMAIIGRQVLNSVYAQLRIPGVREGHYAKYGNIIVEWSSTDPIVKARGPDQSLILANKTDWFQHTIIRVTDTLIDFQNTTRLQNGTQTTNYAWVDVAQGLGNASLMFIAAHLGEGDSLYEGYAAFINKTLSRSYLDEVRNTNYLNLTINYQIPTNPLQNIRLDFLYYWDQRTGVLTERRASFTNQTGNYLTFWSRSDEIIDTNLWGPDTIPPKADAGGDITVRQNELVQFDGSSSSDNVGIISYEWDFGDNTNGQGKTVTHTYTKPGIYNVVLTVTDAAGLTSKDTLKVNVQETSTETFPYWIPGAAIIIMVGALLFYRQKKSKSKIRRRRMLRKHTPKKH